WKKISGGLSGISVGSRSNVWGINPDGAIYRFTNDDATPWHKVPGGLTDISAAADGTVWGVNANHEIFRYIGDQ
ncbi:tectonin domain-containing protein, partial [Streptomyces sp. NRRL S-4]|uniref:tectonin domain-containing protein n=1 Tax=Streptomyces sp. NRRL S-4 TaxID=1519471 RepID=UPI000AB6E19C